MEAERDRISAVVKGCSDGLDLVEVAAKVVEAAHVVVDLECEVANSAAPVEVGGWQVIEGHKRKPVPVVTQLSRPLDARRRGELQGAVGKVQGLLGTANLGWRLVASPYTVYGGDEILWTVRGVELEVDGSKVAQEVLRNLEVVWGVGSAVGCWRESKMSAYVLVQGILERKWLSDKSGVEGFVEGNLRIMWGPRQPVVVSKAWNSVDVKVELMTTDAARSAVVWGLVYHGMRLTVHMAVPGGGASVPRSQSLRTTPGTHNVVCGRGFIWVGGRASVDIDGEKREKGKPEEEYGPIRQD